MSTLWRTLNIPSTSQDIPLTDQRLYSMCFPGALLTQVINSVVQWVKFKTETLQSNFSTSSCYRKHNLLDAISSDFKLLLIIFYCANRKTSEILKTLYLWHTLRVPLPKEKRTYPMQTKTDFVAGSAKIFTKTRICWHKGQLWKTSSFKSYMSHCSACNNRTSKDNGKLASLR